MLIKELEKMEIIVSNNKQLSWDGWDVVHQYQSDRAWSSKDGVFVNNKWYMQKRYAPSINGWDIPDKYAQK